MTMMFQELSERRQRQIGLDEQVLWCGKGRPVAWHDGAIGSCVMGLVTCVFVGAFASVVLPDLFRSRAATGVRLGGAAVAIVVLGAFVTLGLSLLLSPFWHWLGTRSYVWVITSRRVLRFWGPFVSVWNGSETGCCLLDEPEWKFLDDGGRDFAFGRSSGKHKTDVLIESVPPEDVPQVEFALLRLAKLRREARESAVSGKMQAVRGRFRVFRDEVSGARRIVYRDNHLVRSLIWLVLIAGFFGAVIALVIAREHFGVFVVLAILPALFGGSAPFVYGAFGRREVAMENDSGVYFNGVGRIGIYRRFSYDSQTTVRRGQTAYRLNGRHLMEVQLCTQSPAVVRRLFAHPDDAVVETFVQLIREELRK